MSDYKILGISSGRPMGNSEIILKEALMECDRLIQAQIHIIRLRNLKIEQCNGCLECLKDAASGNDGLCGFKDDLELLKEQILWADAIIFSDPCFVYNPTAEIITMMNRAMGAGVSYREKCKDSKKYLGLICVGGSDTIDYSLPIQFYAMERMCRGIELVDQFYANWVRGKGYICRQERHMERARLLARRIVHKLQGYDVPPITVSIEKLNPMEYKDNSFINMEMCPVCHSFVMQMENTVPELGKFKCCVCGAEGHIEEHCGQLSYVWDDESVAHNRLHKEFDSRFLSDYLKAHQTKEGIKAYVEEFPVLEPNKESTPLKPRILALVAGPKGGTSELLARKALQEAVKSEEFEGALIRLTDLNLHFCTGCLVCKVNVRYRGKTDECVLKDDDMWVVDKILESKGIIYSFDGINGFTYGNVVALEQRFGHWSRSKSPDNFPRVMGTIISSFDDQTINPTFIISQFWRQFATYGPQVAQELINYVPLTGDEILKDEKTLERARSVGAKVARAVSLLQGGPEYRTLIKDHNSMCPNCRLNLVEFRKDFTVACPMCDAQGKFEHRFGENDIVWDHYAVTHSRATPFGGALHFKHINFSQTDEKELMDNPQILKEELQKYRDFGQIITS